MIFQHSELHERNEWWWEELKAYRQKLPAAYKWQKFKGEGREKQVLQGQRLCQVHEKSGLKLLAKWHQKNFFSDLFKDNTESSRSISGRAFHSLTTGLK